MAVADLRAPTAPLAGGQAGGHVLGQAQGLAHVADGALGAIADDGGGDARAFAAIAFVDMLDDLLSPLVLEVDVDVGRLAPVRRQKAFEQQVGFGRIDRRDAQHIADGGIGRRAAPLAQDTLVAGHADDVVDSQEIGRVVGLCDEGQLLLQQQPHLLRNAVGIADLRVPPSQVLQPRLRRTIRRRRLLGILITDIPEIEPDPGQQVCGLGDGFGDVAEQAGHFGGRLQPTLAIGVQPPPRLLNRHAFADAGQHVLQVALNRVVIENVVDGQKRRPAPLRQGFQPRQSSTVVAVSPHDRAQPDRARRCIDQARQGLVQPI